MNTKKAFRKNRNQVISILLITLMFGATSCAPSTRAVPSPTASAPTATRTPAPTKFPTNTPVPTATLTPFVPKATIKIFNQGPLSGEYASDGYDYLHAVELAIEQLSGPLTDLGYKIELASYDDENNVERAVEKAKEIIADPQVLCGVGHYAGTMTVAAAEIYHKAGLAILAPNGVAGLTDHGYLEINRIIGNYVGQGAAAAKFANAQGFVKAITISSPWGDYGTRTVYYFKNEAVLLGAPLVVYNTTTELIKDFDNIVTRVLSSNPNVVFFAASPDQAGNFFREARAAGYMGTFMGPNSLSNSSLLEFAGPRLVEGGGMYYTTLAAPASYYPDASTFIEDFTNMYGTPPQPAIANVYDATGICLKAIEEASKAKGGELPTRNEVAKAIRALKDYMGITGTYNFNNNGDLTLAEYFIYKVVSIDPAKWNQNTIVASYKLAPPK